MLNAMAASAQIVHVDEEARSTENAPARISPVAIGARPCSAVRCQGCCHSARGRVSQPGHGRTRISNRPYFDLSTWHLINSLYTPKRQAELRLMRHLYRNPVHHDRLMRVVDRRLGHALAASAERAKIVIAARGDTLIEIDPIEPGLSVAFDEQQLVEATREERAWIVHAAQETARLAGIAVGKVDAVYFTGGSTGLASLTHAIAGAFAQSRARVRRPASERGYRPRHPRKTGVRLAGDP
jgi:hypothetical protein